MHAGYIDEVNDQIISSFPKFHVMRWKVKFLWTFLFGMLHNARRFRMIHENKNIPPNDWKKDAANFFSKTPVPAPTEHVLQHAFHHSNRGRCKLCYIGERSLHIKTTWICAACQIPICVNCFNSSEHFSWVTTPDGLRARWKAKYVNKT